MMVPKGVQQPRRGRVVWDDDDSKGASPAPRQGVIMAQKLTQKG